MKLNTSVWA